MKRIKEIFDRIRQGHLLWAKHDDYFKMRLEQAFKPFFVELEGLGIDRHFSQALLFFGREFVDSLGATDSLSRDVGLVYGVKVKEMSRQNIEEAKLAEKVGALVYKSVPMDGDKVSIKVLTYKKK